MPIPASFKVDFSAHRKDLVAQALSRLLSQHYDKCVLRQFVAAIMAEVQELYDALIDLQEQRTLYMAREENLNGLGRIVGEPRAPYQYDESRWMFADRIDQRVDSASVWCVHAPFASFVPVEDPQYQLNILARIIKNHTLVASVPELERLAHLVTDTWVSWEKTAPCRWPPWCPPPYRPRPTTCSSRPQRITVWMMPTCSPIRPRSRFLAWSPMCLISFFARTERNNSNVTPPTVPWACPSTKENTMAFERVISMIAQWAKGAQTIIPTPPVPGVAYRNAGASIADFEQGQAYDKVYDSARYNQRDFLITGLLQLVEQYGLLPWSSLTNYPDGGFVLGLDNRLYQALRPSGPGIAGVGARNPTGSANPVYWMDYIASVTPPKTDKHVLCRRVYDSLCPTPEPGMVPVNGTLIANAVNLYPKAWAFLQTVEGQSMCVTEAAWQALVKAYWHTNADGSRVGWNSIGGAAKYVIDTNAGTIRVPDLRGMFPEPYGCDGLGVGGVHGDAGRNVTGATFGGVDAITASANAGTVGAVRVQQSSRVRDAYASNAGGYWRHGWDFDTSRVIPVAAKFQPRAWGSLACVYLG